MAKKQGVTEELKATDMMRWIGLMNNIRACADEIVLNDIVYSNGYQPKKNCCQTDGSFSFRQVFKKSLSCEYNRSGRKVTYYIGCNFFMNSIDKKLGMCIIKICKENLVWRCFYEKGRNLKCKQKRTSQ